MNIDTKKLLAAVEEIKVGYKRRYGLGYSEAHVVAGAVPELLEEIERLKRELRSFGIHGHAGR